MQTFTTVVNDFVSTDHAIKWLAGHGIETQLISGRVWAMDVWAKDGEMFHEWVKVTCTMRWLRNWMNY